MAALGLNPIQTKASLLLGPEGTKSRLPPVVAGNIFERVLYLSTNACDEINPRVYATLSCPGYVSRVNSTAASCGTPCVSSLSVPMKTGVTRYVSFPGGTACCGK